MAMRWRLTAATVSRYILSVANEQSPSEGCHGCSSSECVLRMFSRVVKRRRHIGDVLERHADLGAYLRLRSRIQ